MKIFYDHTCFNQRFGGVPRYFVELIKGLRARRLDPEVFVPFADNVFLRELDEKARALPFGNFRGRPQLIKLFGDICLVWRLIFGRRIDIYHATHYSTFPKFFLKRTSVFIVTIHDMNEWAIPEYYPKWSIRKMRQFLHMKFADHIISVSHQTRNDIVRFFPDYAQKVDVIHHGVGAQFPLTKNRVWPRRFILFVGARNTYKNFDRLLHAFRSIRTRDPELDLVCAGTPFTRSERGHISELFGPDDCVHSLAPNDSELAWLYSECEIFVFPSLYEGFGLPCLEGILHGAVPVVSGNSVFPEVCGEGAIYFDPLDRRSMYDAMVRGIEDANLRTQIKIKGKAQLKKFPWATSVSLHAALYRRIYNQKTSRGMSS